MKQNNLTTFCSFFKLLEFHFSIPTLSGQVQKVADCIFCVRFFFHLLIERMRKKATTLNEIKCMALKIH